MSKAIHLLMILVFAALIGKTGVFLLGSDAMMATPSELLSAVSPYLVPNFLPVHVQALLQVSFGWQLTSSELALLAIGGALYGAAVGFVLRVVFGARGFSVPINAALSLCGVWMTMLYYNLRTTVERPEDLTLLAIAAAVASTAMPVAVILFTWRARPTDPLPLSGELNSRARQKLQASTAAGPPRAVSKPGPGARAPAGPSADRIRAAMSKGGRNG